MYNRIEETAAYINKVTNNYKPEIGVILGSGLSTLVDELDVEYRINYSDIPNYPISTVKGHQSELLFAKLKSGKKVVVAKGRFHYYEGYDIQDVSFPVFVMKKLGINTLLVSNASGGMNPNFEVGDIMLITDHINLLPNPLVGSNDERLGPRFPSMHEPYDKNLLETALNVAKKRNVNVKQGIYVGVTGPTFETPAEYRYFRKIGADAVGMSTTPEVIIANYLGVKVLGLSVISDLGGGEVSLEVSHEEVLEAVEKTVPVLVGLVREVLEEI